MENMFLQASKLKLRFATNKGQLSVEDLWDLSLESLDNIAINLDKQLENSSKKSFIGKRDTKSKELELAFDIVKSVIEIKMAEKDAKTKRAAKSAKVAELKALIAEKSVEELKSKSTEELLKELQALEEAEE